MLCLQGPFIGGDLYFGLPRRNIEQDVSEGVVTRVKTILEKAKTPEARCSQMAANGQSCVAYAQRYYMQCRIK